MVGLVLTREGKQKLFKGDWRDSGYHGYRWTGNDPRNKEREPVDHDANPKKRLDVTLGGGSKPEYSGRVQKRVSATG